MIKASKIWITLVIIANGITHSGADTGISTSYRSMPAYVTGADDITHYRTIESFSVGFYLDDFIRGHDKKTAGRYVTKYYTRIWEEPTKKYPSGRGIEQEVDIGDATAEEINMRNSKFAGQLGHVYSRKVYVEGKVLGVLPGWLNPNRGAGYTLVFNVHAASLERQVDFYAIDAALGKRLFLIPHLFHIYGRVGLSILASYWSEYGDRYVNSQLGAVGNFGLQVQALKGVKFFVESEFRGYGPFFAEEASGHVEMINKFPFWRDRVTYRPEKKEETVRTAVKESLRFGLRFTF
jgi:hypothetical protein